MVCVSKEFYKGNAKSCILVSDTTPAELPVNGKGIAGMSEEETFAPMSMLYVTGEAATKVYIANEIGVFVAQ